MTSVLIEGKIFNPAEPFILYYALYSRYLFITLLYRYSTQQTLFVLFYDRMQRLDGLATSKT